MFVFAGSASGELARKICEFDGFKLGKIELSRFDNDEARVRILEKKVGDKCIVIQSLSEPTDHNLVELLLICDALKRMGLKKIIGVVPWLGYSKQDKVFRKGEPLSIEVVARILKVAGLDKLITFDLHKEKIKDYFKIPVVNLSARELLENYFRKKITKDTIVVAPDAGAIKSSTSFARKLGIDVVYIDKKRDLKTGKVEIFGINGQVKNKQAIIMDDMIATGGTLIKTANFLKKRGVQSIKVGVTHHLYVDGVQEKLDKSVIDKVVVMDTVRPRVKSKKLKVLGVAKMITEGINT